ncbi:MAG: T9SS type A sorting domain-containing protein [Candidatus Electryonea clarkiae]|nr:T9SS type A sorting domain-containing protein [Candidatus Electryonea clarkiae]MDP8285468.1 T9SS type A sorting domain-containing protein [Candidatus Electryonea clarkiae]
MSKRIVSILIAAALVCCSVSLLSAQPEPEFQDDVTNFDNSYWTFWNLEDYGTVLYHVTDGLNEYLTYPGEELIFDFELGENESMRELGKYTFDGDDNYEVFVSQQIGDDFPWTYHHYVRDVSTGEIEQEWNEEGSSYAYNKFFYWDFPVAVYMFGMTETAPGGVNLFTLYQVNENSGELEDIYDYQLQVRQTITEVSMYNYDEDDNLEITIRSEVGENYPYSINYTILDIETNEIQWALDEEGVSYNLRADVFYGANWANPRVKIVVTENYDNGTILLKVYVLGPEYDGLTEVMSLPLDATLNQNFPNPFNPSTTISYSLEKASQVKIMVYNIQGRMVDVIQNSQQKAGLYSVPWSPENLASGAYFYQLEVNGKVLGERKALLIK